MDVDTKEKLIKYIEKMDHLQLCIVLGLVERLFNRD